MTVSRICLGCMSYGSSKWRPWVLNEDAARPFFRQALDRGINFFDTADMYSLGVSEATITPSYVGNEKHLLVECPGVVDVQQCIATVGKTIQLEFKEEFTEATAEYPGAVRGKAADALRRITASGVSLAVVGEDLGEQAAGMLGGRIA